MTLQHVDIVFQIIAFLFAISVHESAHAWTAHRLGDPTAFMLGRVTLNPVKHMDPIGTVLMPLIAALTHFPMIGWAKPTPVNTRNFKRIVRDDILTSVAGPVSNFLVATVVVLALGISIAAIPEARVALGDAADFKNSGHLGSESQFVAPMLLLLNALYINVLLACFNLIPVPPLDGSHVIRHFLPERLRNIYDSMGILGLIVLMLFGGRILWPMMRPVLNLYFDILAKF